MIDSRAVLRRAGLHPKKGFGQNFLVAEPVLRAIATACIADDEIGRARVVELGAGVGTLTAALLERARHVSAIERDRDLVPILERELADARANGALSVLESDAATADLPTLLGPSDAASPRVLCGNLPYQITGRLLQRAVENSDAIDRAVFMVQQEVADRLLASPSTKAYGALTIFVRAAFDVARVMTVSRNCFHPPPNVTSAVVKLTPLRPPRARETPTFRALVRRAFEARRKTLRNAWRDLAPGDLVARAAAESGISLDLRGEALDVDAYARMTRALERSITAPV